MLRFFFMQLLLVCYFDGFCPRGRRHLTFAVVGRNMRGWIKAWLRMLKPTGVCTFVTIITKRVDHIMSDDLIPSDERFVKNRETIGVALKESAIFTNSGWEQCKYYVVCRRDRQHDAR